MELLLGCGSSTEKKIWIDGNKTWGNLVRLDFNADHKPDVVHDLEVFPYPFDTDTFDEIHAYEVLEHTGAQGDFHFFFKQFEELHRITKPNGHLLATVPRWDSIWAFGDPSHKRVLSGASLTFLDQDQYEKQVGKTAMSDFRFCYKADWKTVYVKDEGDTFCFILRAIK